MQFRQGSALWNFCGYQEDYEAVFNPGSFQEDLPRAQASQTLET